MNSPLPLVVYVPSTTHMTAIRDYSVHIPTVKALVRASAKFRQISAKFRYISFDFHKKLCWESLGG